MYTYKCYYHPRVDSVRSCKGCLLPICDTCRDEATYCPACVKKRSAVDKLRAMRADSPAARRMTTPSGRLRLPGHPGSGTLVLPAPSRAPTQRFGTRPLSPALAPELPDAVAAPASEQRRYNPRAVAYQPPVALPGALPAVEAIRKGRLTPFLAGLLAGVLLMSMLFVLGPLLTKPRRLPHAQGYLERPPVCAHADSC